MGVLEIVLGEFSNMECLQYKNDYIGIAEVVSDDKYIVKCQYAMCMLEAKLEVIGNQLKALNGRDVVREITGRIKTAESIYAKLERKGYDCTFEEAQAHLNDLIGVRVVCLFQDDVYNVAAQLKKQKDIVVIREKDYIKNPKSNGYMSLHLIVEIPVCYEDEYIYKRVEVQIRTVAMDFWSVLDYQLFYKKNLKGADRISRELKEYAQLIAGVDRKMMRLRNEIENI